MVPAWWLNTLFGRFPNLPKLFAVGGYQGPLFAKGAARPMPRLSGEITKRCEAARGFEVPPKRWVVERSLGWFRRCLRAPGISKTSTGRRWCFFAWHPFRLMLRRLCTA